jgi:hypothetical protein
MSHIRFDVRLSKLEARRPPRKLVVIWKQEGETSTMALERAGLPLDKLADMQVLFVQYEEGRPDAL